MSIFDVISLFGGLALFLYGMRIMGDGLQSSSAGTLKLAMEKVTNSSFKSFLLGLFVTAIIQSSNATVIITSGLVGAGIISLRQSIGIILGANVGTTMTGQIIRLLDVNAGGTSWLNFFKPSTLAPLASIIGILLIMFIKSKKSETVGGIAMGFGILFTGLMNMTGSVSALSESESFRAAFVEMGDTPLMGFLAGLVVCFILQSASASVGILQAISMTGVLSFKTVYPIILGIFLGSCVTTALVCSIGAKAEARRTGMIHVLFNICKIILVFTGVSVMHSMGLLDSIWSVPISSGGIADANTVFNLACTLIMLPVCAYFETVARAVIKDDPVDEKISREFNYLDESLFRSPDVALSSAFKALESMARSTVSNVQLALKQYVEYDPAVIGKIEETEEFIDQMADAASAYLIKLSSCNMPTRTSDLLNYYLTCVSEFERISDHALNLCENVEDMQNKGCTFSEEAKEELAVMSDTIDLVIETTLDAFVGGSYDTARHIEPAEEIVDRMVDRMQDGHMSRLRKGQCNVDSGFIFLDMLSNLERISDQCSNIGLHTLALFDPEINGSEHDYVSRLHNGSDPEYDAEVKLLTDKYLGRLKTL